MNGFGEGFWKLMFHMGAMMPILFFVVGGAWIWQGDSKEALILIGIGLILSELRQVDIQQIIIRRETLEAIKKKK